MNEIHVISDVKKLIIFSLLKQLNYLHNCIIDTIVLSTMHVGDINPLLPVQEVKPNRIMYVALVAYFYVILANTVYLFIYLAPINVLSMLHAVAATLLYGVTLEVQHNKKYLYELGSIILSGLYYSHVYFNKDTPVYYFMLLIGYISFMITSVIPVIIGWIESVYKYIADSDNRRLNRIMQQLVDQMNQNRQNILRPLQDPLQTLGNIHNIDPYNPDPLPRFGSFPRFDPLPQLNPRPRVNPGPRVNPRLRDNQRIRDNPNSDSLLQMLNQNRHPDDMLIQLEFPLDDLRPFPQAPQEPQTPQDRVLQQVLTYDIKELICNICLEKFVESSRGEMSVLPCKHIFHTTCLQTWTDTHTTCPTCRFELPSNFTVRDGTNVTDQPSNTPNTTEQKVEQKSEQKTEQNTENKTVEQKTENKVNDRRQRIEQKVNTIYNRIQTVLRRQLSDIPETNNQVRDQARDQARDQVLPNETPIPVEPSPIQVIIASETPLSPLLDENEKKSDTL